MAALAPNVITYSAGISGRVKGHRPELALARLAEMQGRELEPDVFAFNGTAHACRDSNLNVRLRG